MIEGIIMKVLSKWLYGIISVQTLKIRYQTETKG